MQNRQNPALIRGTAVYDLLYQKHDFKIQTVMSCMEDFVAAAYEEIEDVDEFVKCRPAGFGGTNFKRSVIPWIKQKLDNGDIDEVKAIVTLTDGFDSLNDCDTLLEKNEINCDLFWIITSSENEVPDPNCGRTARLKVDKYNC